MKGIQRLTMTLAAAGLTALGAAADRIELDRNMVIPVKFDQELSIKGSREGDRFTATVDKNRDLPPGTYFRGRILNIDKKKNKESLKLAFDEIVLPDGTRARIHAVPVKWDGKDRYEDDGKFDAKQGKDDGKSVFNGIAIGGLLGSLIKKPFEGVIIGALAGVIINETERGERGNLVIRKDAKMGAYIQEYVELEYEPRRDSPYYGASRDDDDRWELARRDRSNDRDREAADERLPRDQRDSRQIGEIRVGDQSLRFNSRYGTPYYEGKTLMVPIVDAARQLELDYDQSPRSGRIYVFTQDRDLVLEQDSKKYRLNGKSREMDQRVTEKDGVVYVPVKVIGELLEKSIYLDDKKVSG
ncbi:MAG: hypothetical protein KF784_01950 [Fimbriimonadaceae bacterium]|nr:hypothetical protein [Fimbriimonadaceae bacterium]